MCGLDWHQFKPIKIVILSRALRIRRESAWSFTCLSKISYPLAFDLLFTKIIYHVYVVWRWCLLNTNTNTNTLPSSNLHAHLGCSSWHLLFVCFLSKQDCYGAKYILHTIKKTISTFWRVNITDCVIYGWPRAWVVIVRDFISHYLHSVRLARFLTFQMF